MTEPQQEMYLAERVAIDAESTSAALRRVEQERDEARAHAKDALAEVKILTQTENYELVAAQAELASARTELDAVRTARDTLERELAELWSTGVIRRSDAGATDG